VVTPYANAFLGGSNVTNIPVQSQCSGDPVAHGAKLSPRDEIAASLCSLAVRYGAQLKAAPR
jgi:hypothetical protein